MDIKPLPLNLNNENERDRTRLKDVNGETDLQFGLFCGEGEKTPFLKKPHLKKRFSKQ